MHCRGGCSALRERLQCTASEMDKTGTEIATPILDKRIGRRDSPHTGHCRPLDTSAEPLHHTQGDALGYVLIAPSGRALNACAYSLIQLAQVELGKNKDLCKILTAKLHKVESFSFC